MIWYSVDNRCDEFLITFMKSRDAKLSMHSFPGAHATRVKLTSKTESTRDVPEVSLCISQDSLWSNWDID